MFKHFPAQLKLVVEELSTVTAEAVEAKQAKEEVVKFLLAVVERFKAFKKSVTSYSNSKRHLRASASKAKSSVLSQLSGLENVVFNVFIDDKLDSESGIMSQTQM